MTEANPYESPQEPQPLATARPFSWRKVVVGAILLILLMPATGFAFLTSCIVALELTNNDAAALGSAALCALVTFAVIVMLFAYVARSTPGPQEVVRRDRSDAP
jgi:hypothetical protein